MGKGSSKAPEPAPAGASLVDEYTPWGNSTYKKVGKVRVAGGPDQDRYRLDVQLTPEQRKLFEQEQKLNQGLNQLAIDQTGRLTGHLSSPVSYGGAPSVNAGRIQSGLSMSGLPETQDLDSSGLSGIRQLSTGGLPGVNDLNNKNLSSVRQISMDGLSDLPGIDDFGGERQRVEDALYQRQTSRLDPQWEQQQRREGARLAAQGVTEGSAAYRTAMDNFNRSRNDAYSSARNDAILAGGGEQSRLFGDALAGRGQQFGERQAINSADMALRGQQFGERESMTAADLATRGQMFGERSAVSDADLARRNQLFGERAANSSQALANRGQMFGERQASGAFANTAQQQGYDQQNQDRARYIEELLSQRNQPINEIAALLGTGGQVQAPQFRGSGEVGNAAAQAYAGQMAGWQQQQEGRNAAMGGLFGLGGRLGAAGITAFGR